MRYAEIISETVRRIEVPDYNRVITVWSDLTKAALVSLAMKHDLRGITTERHFWVWDSFLATHGPMAKALGINNSVYVYISGKAEADTAEWQTSPRYIITKPVYCYYGMTGDPILTRLGDFLSEDDEDEDDDYE